MSRIEITKAKILNGPKVFITYTKTDKDGRISEHEDRYKNTPHKDFTDSFAALAPHAAMLAEFIDEGQIKDIRVIDPEMFKDFAITGFTVTGSDDKQGVIITGQKTLRTGKKMSFNTPFTNLNAEGEGAYIFIDDLWDKLQTAQKHATNYLNGTFAPDPQGSLFPEGEDGEPGETGKAGQRGTVIKVLKPQTEEEKILENLQKDGQPVPQDDLTLANPDAMARVATIGSTETGKSKNGRKRVAQSPDNPSGEE